MRPLALLALLLLPGAAAATAQPPCPVPVDRLAEIDELIPKAPSCRAAGELFLACTMGSSGDVIPGDLVRERCEPEILARLDREGRRRYRRAIATCDRKYRHEDGTMYRSFESACRVQSVLARAPRTPRSDFGWVARALGPEP